MNFDSSFDFSPNVKLTDRNIIKTASEILKYANVCIENVDADLLDVLMTTLWICVHAKTVKNAVYTTTQEVSKRGNTDSGGGNHVADERSESLGSVNDPHTDITAAINTPCQNKPCRSESDIEGRSIKDRNINYGSDLLKQNHVFRDCYDRCSIPLQRCDKSITPCAAATGRQHDANVSGEDGTLDVHGDSPGPYTEGDCWSDSFDNSFGSTNSKSDYYITSNSFQRKVKTKIINEKPVRKKRKIKSEPVEDAAKVDTGVMPDESDRPEPVMILTNVYNKCSSDMGSIVDLQCGEQSPRLDHLQTPATPSSSIVEEVFMDLLPNPNQEKSYEKYANIKSANYEVISLLSQPQGKRKRGPYIQYNSEERARIGQLACEYGTAVTMRRFVQEFGKPVHESTVRSIKKQYILQCQRSDEKVKMLGKKVGRPKLSGEFDKDVVEYVQKLRTSGALVNRKIVIAGATGIIKNKASHLLKENGGHIILDNSWAESLLRRVGFRRKCLAKEPCDLPKDFDELQHQFQSEVHSMIDSLQVPDQLVINIHQTKINIIPGGNWVADPAGFKQIESRKMGDKRRLTALLTSTMAGELLPMQVLYSGKTDQCHSRVTFPSDWDVWHSEKQCVNEETLRRFTENILIPYIQDMRAQLELNEKHPALVVLDANAGPKSEKFLQTLLAAGVHVKVIPWDCASKLEPLSIAGKSHIKEEIKSQFISWYADQVAEEIGGAREVGSVQSQLKLTWMKPIHAGWVVNAWSRVKEEAQIVLDGWLQSGIKRVKYEIEIV